jgi:hypothetical protein
MSILDLFQKKNEPFTTVSFDTEVSNDEVNPLIKQAFKPRCSERITWLEETPSCEPMYMRFRKDGEFIVRETRHG